MLVQHFATHFNHIIFVLGLRGLHRAWAWAGFMAAFINRLVRYGPG